MYVLQQYKIKGPFVYSTQYKRCLWLRVQKQRAEKSQDALEKMSVQLMERDAQLEDLRSQLELMGPRYDKMSKEKSQLLAENSALKT